MLRVVAFLFLIFCEHPTLKAWSEFSHELRVVKTVRQSYRPTEEILSLLEDFRCMVNDCVRIGLKENVTSMKSLCSASKRTTRSPRMTFRPTIVRGAASLSIGMPTRR